MGIEPTYPAWKAGVLPLNYTRKTCQLSDVIPVFKQSARNSLLQKNRSSGKSKLPQQADGVPNFQCNKLWDIGSALPFGRCWTSAAGAWQPSRQSPNEPAKHIDLARCLAGISMLLSINTGSPHRCEFRYLLSSAEEET